MGAVFLKEFSWERMIGAVEEVRERALRATGALQQAGIPHVVVLLDLLGVGLIDESWCGWSRKVGKAWRARLLPTKSFVKM
jgi:hypothetical protein